MTDRRTHHLAVLALGACSAGCPGPSGAVQTTVVVVRPAAPLVVAAPATPEIGCADGTREGFQDVERHPHIAGCSGAFGVPGVLAANDGIAPACPGLPVADSTARRCGPGAGNDASDPSGRECTVADLCAPGWHVCTGAADVAASGGVGCKGATHPRDPPLFFATRQSSNGCGVCADGARRAQDCNGVACTPGCAPTDRLSNDVFGCGNFGTPAACGGLDRFTNNLCTGLAGSPWSCDAPGPADDNGLCEAFTLVKSGPSHGGVLCCRGRRWPAEAPASP
jgi:hypothetical protein